MNQSILHNYLHLLQVSALSNTAPASDVQHVVSHLQAIMPLHTASVSERFKRQVQNESGTSGDQAPRPPPPPPPMHAKYLKVGRILGILCCGCNACDLVGVYRCFRASNKSNFGTETGEMYAASLMCVYPCIVV